MSSTSVTHANWAAVDTPEFHKSFEDALAKRRAQDEASWDLLVGDERRGGQRYEEQVSPGDPNVRLGRAAHAGPGDVEDAVLAAHAAFAGWRSRPPEVRIELIREVAKRIEERQFDLAALISLEIGKNRFEARTEVEEGIELLRFYCRTMEEQRNLLTEFPPLGDEHSVSVGRPYGVWAILGPFNFPFALVAGMGSAALLTGNTIVVKPPDRAPASSLQFAEICVEVGIPPGVVNLVMGDPEVGRQLVGHRLVEGVGFIGSMEVGHAIRRELDGKPVVAEMGGKNAAILTASGELETAAEAICRSAFRYAGQKCSACSRVFVDESMTDALADEIFARAQKLVIGVPWEADTVVGPLIEARAKQRFDAALEEVRADARRTLETELPAGLPDGAAYTESAIAVDLPPDHELLGRELFAPLLCIQSVKDLDEAIARANAVPYGLTSGLYSGEQEEIERYLDQIEAGVVYVNRPTGATTGAWVGHQSFGGWKGSGSTGANAHGPYYLQQFVREQSRTVVER